MLTEIYCEKFKQKKIVFHKGLNVILGDNQATNSIGKSTLLMLIDFIFGGQTFLEHNRDVVIELKDHDYYFTFEFGSEKYRFRRGTYKSDLVYKCDEEYKETEPISIEDYRDFLKNFYNLSNIDLSFRSCISLFSRVWGKENLDVKQPLHSFKKQRASDCVINVLKIFNKYESLRSLNDTLKSKQEDQTAFKSAKKKNFIPQVSNKQYKINLKSIQIIQNEIDDIKQNLARFSVNINEVLNKEILEFKEEKDNLLEEKITIESRLNRIQKNLLNNKYIKSKQLSALVDFFPEVDTGRISKIEEFHSGITLILKKELKESEKELISTLDFINQEIEKIDFKISSALENIESPNVIIDRVYNLSKSHIQTSEEIGYYETEKEISSDLNQAKNNLSEEKKRLTKTIEDVINDKIRKYVNKVYNEERRNPILLLGEKSYKFEAIEDTGTGKAYSNLILLDLAFFSTTCLPVMIHDSLLFKNIENDAVANLIDLYMSFEKQSFIAIDEIKKYGIIAENKLLTCKNISLSDDNLLYIKDWRR